MSNIFPKNFIWGAATSSYQIEGATNIDGKGKSIWDKFSHTKGKVANNENGDIATDHYNRYKDDVALMSDIRLKAYRFSISWPRILPNGKGKYNTKGLDFYSKLLDELLKKNIKPFITLYHWDLPQKIQDSGGWSNRDITKYFSDYSYLIAKKFGDKCKNIITLNEPAVFSTFGYLDGYMAPGLRNKKQYFSSIHNINLAHGFAYKSIKSISSKINVGCTLNMAPCLAVSNSRKNENAKIIYDTFWNRAYADPMYLGIYPKIIEKKIQHLIKQNDMKIISQKNDFIGLNHYQHIRVISDKNNLLGARSVNLNELPKKINKKKLTSMNWEIVPNAYYNQIMELKNRYNNPIIHLTENGCSYPDVKNKKGKIIDAKRISFLKKYLKAVKKALKDGARIKSYFVWSLLDNFEWSLGYEKRFGIIHVDFKNLERTPKKSYYFYAKLIKKNSIPK
tara:strand:+ start:244 stop:1593 length:1350 start_codon:yes stop_codon:yes gene_type:complete